MFPFLYELTKGYVNLNLIIYIYVLHHLNESHVNLNMSFALTYTVQAYVLVHLVVINLLHVCLF